uniref:Uncharacterized protein n=1 Tax=Panagrolaimus sp. ES5 TaxID=591445 RepID=A0AC34GHG3_9BILA
IAVGGNVTGVNVGDEVIAVIPGFWPGSHAEYVLTKSDAVARKPSNVNYLEATSLPYVACLPFGLLSTALKYFDRSCRSFRDGRWFSYAYFMPNSQCLNQISEFIDNEKIKIPHIEKVYKFNEFPTAYDRCALLHTKGKLIIDIAEEPLPSKIDPPPPSSTVSPYHPGTKSVPVIDLKPPPLHAEPAPVVA